MAAKAIVDQGRSGADTPVVRLQDLVAAGHLLDAITFGASMGMSERDLDEAVQAGRMFSLDVCGAAYFPAFFLVGAAQRQELEAACKALGDISPASKWLFLRPPSGPLVRTRLSRERRLRR